MHTELKSIPSGLEPQPAVSGQRPLSERDHELRAALYGMEALARGLCDNREHLPSAQVDDLLLSLVAEIRRVRALVAGRVGRPRTFDLAAAIGPVVSCARAAGLDV